MKKFISIIIAFALVLCIGIIQPNKAEAEKFVTLSDLSEQECIEFLSQAGLDIPSELKDVSNIGTFVKNTITDVENNPHVNFTYNYLPILVFANQIKEVVNAYYGVDDESVVFSSGDYVLQYNTVVGSWSYSYVYYNCYGYSIQTLDWAVPGDYSGQAFSLNLTIYQMALLVKDDLNALGYECVKLTTVRPSSLLSGQKAICIRKGSYDFHFMKLSSDVWLHKPGNTAILQYNYLPEYSRIWYSEYSFANVAYPPDPDLYYDSIIYYIIYSAEHNYVNRWTGEHYHSGDRHYYQYADTCTNCGDRVNYSWISVPCSGPPCYLPYSIIVNYIQ